MYYLLDKDCIANMLTKDWSALQECVCDAIHAQA
jgi:hypothetical protein